MDIGGVIPGTEWAGIDGAGVALSASSVWRHQRKLGDEDLFPDEPTCASIQRLYFYLEII